MFERINQNETQMEICPADLGAADCLNAADNIAQLCHNKKHR
jgi:hypothetical protein